MTGFDSVKAYKICLNSPGTSWSESFLLGNGAMGQAVYGDEQEMIIELSNQAFFSGSDSVSPIRGGAPEAFQKARAAASRGDYEAVGRYVEAFMGKRGNYGTNLPVGRLLLHFPEKGRAEDYTRTLDLMRGVMSVHCRCGGKETLIEAFSSHPDQVFAMRIRNPGGDFSIGFLAGQPCRHIPDTPMEGTDSRADTGREAQTAAFSFSMKALESIHSDGTEGVSLTGTVRVFADAGSCSAKDGSILVRGANEAVVCVAMETDFCTEQCAVGLDESERLRITAERTARVDGKYEAVRKRHISDFFPLMERQLLSLTDSAAVHVLPEDDSSDACIRESYPCFPDAQTLLREASETGENRLLTELMYEFGRYLLLSSSREDSVLPAHLQGVWNDSVACRIGWTCDMHLDINTQMNYWISEAGNLSECHMPLFEWMEKRLIPNGRITASGCYGLPGWAAELVSNAWGYAAPYWDKNLSPCPTGGIWQASDYMEHFRFTQDEAFLRERALPVLSEAMDFFLNYVFEDGEGRLTCGPSISPENSFTADGKRGIATIGCTYEVLMIRELLNEYLELCGILGVNDDRCGKAAEVLRRLPDYRVQKDGTLAEWTEDFEACDPQHRHTSHLLGLFPYDQITPDKTPELARAAAASIRKRLTPYDNWEDTGWARALLFLYSCRLWDGEAAGFHLLGTQKNLTWKNLLVMHPATRGTGTDSPVYELDGNTGFSMGVSEMLIQSREGSVTLLPALPECFPEGSFKGACCRGGIRVDFSWKAGRPDFVEATAIHDTETDFIFREKRVKVFLPAGQPRRVCWP